MGDGKYYYAKAGNKAFFKLAGTLKYTSAGKFDAFLDHLLGGETDFEDAMIDLSETVFIDSTNLGFLARISEFMADKFCKKITIYSPRSEINQILESVGFDEVFILVNDAAAFKVDMNEITPAAYEERHRAEMMLDAHKALIRVSDKNTSAFKDVVEILESSVKKKE